MGGGWKPRGNIGGSLREEMQTKEEEIRRGLRKEEERREG